MRVLIVHNRYLLPGGEDEVFGSERRLLETFGHQVDSYEVSNREILQAGAWGEVAAGPRACWSFGSAAAVGEILRRRQPDVMHVHNWFPLISPAVYREARRRGVAVVQSLHNPRLVCPGASLSRRGETCTDCVGRGVAWPAVTRGCYQESRLRTAAVAFALAMHRYRGTWRRDVDAFIVFTKFFQHVFTAGGLPEAKIHVKPHFVEPDPGVRTGPPGDYALYVGRLSEEKGVRLLLKAWSRLEGIPLVVRGDGPLKEEVTRFAAGNPKVSVRLVGRLSRTELSELIKGARFLVWPSLGCYETFGLVAIEAFACGVPVLGSDAGAMAEIVEPGRTGLHFPSGDAEGLAGQVRSAWMRPVVTEAMGRAAREVFESRYTARANHGRLMEVYATARSQIECERAVHDSRPARPRVVERAH
ncbi:MAG: glycosyltransferase family 4 protein [Acidobacteria bacterium]|nr:glycosyltransferase family 4 protein [Acidobacteriota bacterium]